MKLRDFKGEKGIQVVGKLLLPIMNIVGNPENAGDGRGIIQQVSGFFTNNPHDVMEVLAILDDVPVEGYEINAQTALQKLLSWFDDPELLGLFGLQSKTPTSSGSATMTTKE